MVLLCSETFTSFSLPQDRVKTCGPVRKAPPQSAYSTLSLQFRILLRREQTATLRLAYWLVLACPGLYLPHPPALPPSPNPAHRFRASSSPHLPKASLWCQGSDNPSRTTLLVPVPTAPSCRVTSSSPSLVTGSCAYFVFVMRLKLLCTRLVSCCPGGPTTSSVVSCTQTLIYLLQ